MRCSSDGSVTYRKSISTTADPRMPQTILVKTMSTTEETDVNGHSSSSSNLQTPAEVLLPTTENSASEEGPKKKRKPEPTWFEIDDDHNTSVYVNHLPLDITEDDFVTLMKKTGLIMKDDAGNWKVKLYKDREGNFKGDALCRYIKVESVDLALQILDGYNYNGHVISVEKAKFNMKGDKYDPTKKPRKKSAREKRKEQRKMEKLFDWRPDRLPGERPTSEMVAIIENMFDMSEFEKDPRLILEYKNDLRDECVEKCGEVKKVEIYDRNANGVAAVHFKSFESADSCVALMNGRWFAGRQLRAYHWDGKTKYQIKETEEEAEERIRKWNEYLESEEGDSSQRGARQVGSEDKTPPTPPSPT